MTFTKKFISKAVALAEKKGLKEASKKLNVSEDLLTYWVENSSKTFKVDDPVEIDNVRETVDFLNVMVGFN